MDITHLEQYTNEQVGAAAKALLLTWLITAEEVQAGAVDEDPCHKYHGGPVQLLDAQAKLLDDEYTMHALGYFEQLPATKHDQDVAQTAAQSEALTAACVLAHLVANLITKLGK